MRQSAITYVALEFTWPNGKRAETWGLRIEFTSAAEAHGKVTPFFIPAAFTRGDFLDTEKRPLDYSAFKALAESREGRLYTEGLDAYLRDMAQPTHLNFDRAVLRALLPTAMSFTFLKSFNDFARNFILPADKLDVSDVTASYRTFLGYERDLNNLNDQFEKLKAIRDTFTRLTDLRRDRVLARYLEAQLRHEHAAEQLQADEERLAKLKAENAGEEKRLAELVELIERGRAESKKIDALIGETPEGQLYKFIKGRNSELTQQISSLSGIGKSLDDALANRLRNARSWSKELRALPIELEAASVNAVERAIQAVADKGVGKGESLVRFTSCVLCGDSKTLESLAAMDRDGEFRDKLRGKLGRLLEEITSGQIRSLDDMGILLNPRFALIHGPLKLRLDGAWLDLGQLRGAFRLAESDIERAESLITTGRRCLTIENETSFHELAKLQSSELLIQTSYPGSGTLKLLQRLPAGMEFWHFGDSDEAGFDILRVLREKSGRNFQPLHMQRGRIPFEQESLGRPKLKHWPFYD